MPFKFKETYILSGERASFLSEKVVKDKLISNGILEELSSEENNKVYLLEDSIASIKKGEGVLYVSIYSNINGDSIDKSIYYLEQLYGEKLIPFSEKESSLEEAVRR